MLRGGVAIATLITLPILLPIETSTGQPSLHLKHNRSKVRPEIVYGTQPTPFRQSEPLQKIVNSTLSLAAEGFFGQSLPPEIGFASQAGLPRTTRQAVAYIRTRDRKTRFILAIFAEDPAYAQDEHIFPQLSRHIFDSMLR